MLAYWKEHGQFLAAAATEGSYQSAWLDSLGEGKRVAQIAERDVADTVRRWREAGKVGSITINHYLRLMQRIWNRAKLYEDCIVQPIDWKKFRLAEPEPVDRSLTAAEVRRYLDALPTRSIPITLWGWLTGLRLGALLRLQVSDLDWERGIVNATSKGRAGGKPTPVPMTQPLLAVMTKYPPPAVGRIFAVTRDIVRNDREDARATAGLPGFRFHDLRHTFAQALEDEGYGDAITAALHHSDPKLRKRYSRARLQRTQAVIDAAFATKFRHQA